MVLVSEKTKREGMKKAVSVSERFDTVVVRQHHRIKMPFGTRLSNMLFVEKLVQSTWCRTNFMQKLLHSGFVISQYSLNCYKRIMC